MKILFLIRSLQYGGAERQLVGLAKALRDRGHSVAVAVFYPGGPLELDLLSASIPLRGLDKRGRWDLLGFLFRLHHVLKQDNPDILHSYLPVSNILAVLIKPLFPSVRIAWSERFGYMDLDRYDWLSGVSYKLERHLSRFADLIIFNSRAGLNRAIRQGFPKDKTVVVTNGIDNTVFVPNLAARKQVRDSWRIADHQTLVGLVGRLDPMKDHQTFLRAASLLAKERQDVRFVCVGEGPSQYLTELVELADELDLGNRLIWAGFRMDMAAVMNAFDIVCSSSYGEGFPNAIGEAMACGTPCVVTDVGDSAWIVGNTGEVVPARNPEALVDGLKRMLNRLCLQPGLRKQVRDRAVGLFGLDAMADRTCAALERLCALVGEYGVPG